MKKVFVTAVLLVSTFGFSQEVELKDEKVKTVFYIGLGLENQKFNLNDKLKTSNVATLSENAMNFQIGMNFFGKKYSGDVEFDTSLSTNDNNNSENLFMGFSTRLRFHYNIVNKEKIAFTGGLNLSFASNQATFYSKNRTIDLNNLQLNNNFGEYTLRNNMFFAGPSIAFYFNQHKKSRFRINLGYEFALTNGYWRSDYANIANSVKENGNNRLIFGISLL
jgi:hypothetical protein